MIYTGNIGDYGTHIERHYTECYVTNGCNERLHSAGNDSNLLIVFYVQIMPDDFVMQLHRF